MYRVGEVERGVEQRQHHNDGSEGQHHGGKGVRPGHQALDDFQSFTDNPVAENAQRSGCLAGC